MLNRWVGIGRLTADPELRYTTSGRAVTTFRIACDRPFKNAQGEREADFIKVKTWNKLAENCGQYLAKGKLVAVAGELRIQPYEGQDGQRRYDTYIDADTVRFLSPKSGTTAEGIGSEVNYSDDDSRGRGEWWWREGVGENR